MRSDVSRDQEYAVVFQEAVLFGCLARRMWSRLRWCLPSDVVEDCLQEARLTLWKLRDRLEALPEAEQAAYACACVRRAVHQCLQRDLRQKLRACALEELKTEEGSIVELHEEAPADWQALLSDHLTDCVSDPRLLDAFHILQPRDQEILDLFYASEWTEQEIALFLRLTAANVRKRRNRAIHTISARMAVLSASPADAEAGAKK